MKENGPIYLMIFLMFVGFCNFMRLPFDKDILIAIINGLFILVAAIYGTNTLARKNQMRKYSEQIEKARESLMDQLQEIGCWTDTLYTDIEKGGIKDPNRRCEIEDKLFDMQAKYNRELIDYRILLREIQFYCGEEVSCEFRRIDFCDTTNNQVVFGNLDNPTRNLDKYN